MIIGDFNGHIDGLGEQRQDGKGRMILDWINEYASKYGWEMHWKIYLAERRTKECD